MPGRADRASELFAARTGYENFSFAWQAGQFQSRLCRRPTRGRQSPRPLDPALRPASPPLRGPFASSGFLTDRRDAPSLALVLKSIIRSAVLTASLPRFYLLLLMLIECRWKFPKLALAIMRADNTSVRKNKDITGGVWERHPKR